MHTQAKQMAVDRLMKGEDAAAGNNVGHAQRIDGVGVGGGGGGGGLLSVCGRAEWNKVI
jgi:hypothetical protein